MNQLLKTSCLFLFWIFLFGNLSGQHFKIELLSPRAGEQIRMQDSMLVLAFRIEPPDNYAIKVSNYLPDNITLESSPVRTENKIYICDVPLKKGRNDIKVLAYRPKQPSNIRLESLDVYYDTYTPPVITARDTIEKVVIDTLEKLITVSKAVLPFEINMIQPAPDEGNRIVWESDTFLLKFQIPCALPDSCNLNMKVDGFDLNLAQLENVNNVFRYPVLLREGDNRFELSISKAQERIAKTFIVQYQIPEIEIVDEETFPANPLESTTATIPEVNPEIILHRPHHLDNPMKGNKYVIHDRAIEIRFSVMPFDSGDVFKNYIYDLSAPTAAQETRQNGNTFYERINLNKKQNKIAISVNNLTKEISLEKTIEVLYEPEDFSRKGKDYALFIAVQEYDLGWLSLKNPINDVEAMGKVLETKYGFETDYLLNPTGIEIEEAIRTYAEKKYSPHDQLLIFLSGHGAYDKLFKNGYFAPRDAEAFASTKRSFYSYSELKEQIDKMACQKILLMIDACYSGSFFDFEPLPVRHFPDEEKSLEMQQRIYYEMEKDTYKAITSTDRKTGSYDSWKDMTNSPFTNQILKVLNTRDSDGIVDLNDLMLGIKATSSIGQVPVLHSFEPLKESPGADFYFIQR